MLFYRKKPSSSRGLNYVIATEKEYLPGGGCRRLPGETTFKGNAGPGELPIHDQKNFLQRKDTSKYEGGDEVASPNPSAAVPNPRGK